MVDERLLKILVCPWCLGEIDHGTARLSCTKCEAVYRIEDDIPVMLAEEADLYCGACKLLMEKRGVNAVCTTCGRHYRTDIRVEGNLLEHARRFCPLGDPQEVELEIGERESICPRCGATYPT